MRKSCWQNGRRPRPVVLAFAIIFGQRMDLGAFLIDYTATWSTVSWLFRNTRATKQKVLEVFARRISARTYSLRGRGSIFSFDEKGYLERERAEEIMGFIVEQARQKLKGGNVISIEPTLRERRFKRDHHWEPTRSMLRLISVDFQKAPRTLRRIRVLKRPV